MCAVQVRVLEEHANVRPFPESKSAPSDEHPGDSRPRKYYFLCLTKRSPQVWRRAVVRRVMGCREQNSVCWCHLG